MIIFYIRNLPLSWVIVLSQFIAVSYGLKIFTQNISARTKLEVNRFKALFSSSSNGYEGHESHEGLSEISFSYPSGLLINNAENSSFCLLQHNVVNLRPNYRRVLQYEGAIASNTCDQIIEKAEICASQNDGWTANRHSAYPTTDLPLEAIFGKFSAIHGLVNGDILPQMASFFDLNEDHLRIGELFVAKYEYGENKQAGLGAHVDGTPWSFVVSLNDPETEFTGGGTHFVDEGATYRPPKAGTAVIFSGKNKHMGVPITSGVRYILTGFCNYVDPDVSHQNFMASYDRLYDGSAASGKKGRHTDTSFSAESTSTSEGSDLDFTGQMSEPSSSVKLTETDSGIRTGDLLKGIWVNYNDLASLEQIKDFSTFKVDKRLYPEDSSGIRNSVGDQESGSLSANESGVYILTDGLSTEEIKKVVGFSRSSHRTMASSVLIQRDNQAEEETPLNEVQRNFPRTAQGLLSTGKYWSYDECLSGEE